MNEQHYYQGTGRRKEAVARVRLFDGGSGGFVINGRNADDYFGVRPMMQRTIREALTLTDSLERYDVSVKVEGGGIAGQAEAVRHGIARALLEVNSDWRGVLKKAGYLTRDARAKERKKPGLKRARKRPQYTKR